MTTGTGVTATEVRRLLSDRRIFPDLPEDLSEDTSLVLDSMGLVWFLHQLQAQHGVKVEPSDADLHEFTSVGGIVAYIHRAASGE